GARGTTGARGSTGARSGRGAAAVTGGGAATAATTRASREATGSRPTIHTSCSGAWRRSREQPAARWPTPSPGGDESTRGHQEEPLPERLGRSQAQRKPTGRLSYHREKKAVNPANRSGKPL